MSEDLLWSYQNQMKTKQNRSFHPILQTKKETQIYGICIQASALLHILRVSKRHRSICKYCGWDLKECLVFV